MRSSAPAATTATSRGRICRFDSPYNTYRYAGLPPGPIAAPGQASLEAAANPADVPYLYFVSRNDGSHVFSTTLDEHNRNVHNTGGTSGTAATERRGMQETGVRDTRERGWLTVSRDQGIGCGVASAADASGTVSWSVAPETDPTEEPVVVQAAVVADSRQPPSESR